MCPGLTRRRCVESEWKVLGRCVNSTEGNHPYPCIAVQSKIHTSLMHRT